MNGPEGKCGFRQSDSGLLELPKVLDQHQVAALLRCLSIKNRPAIG